MFRHPLRQNSLPKRHASVFVILETMLLSDFDYHLPEELIAQKPSKARDESRMLIVERAKKTWRDNLFSEFPAMLNVGDCVVVNNTRVFPARLIGRRKDSGGRVELLLLREIQPHVWETLARPARRLSPGAKVEFGSDNRLRSEVIETTGDARRIVRFECEEDFHQLLEELGRVPLPPYIKRDQAIDKVEDRERYQTVYARESGAVAAPTAGLHFTPRIIGELKARGIRVAEITLHVGYGTFEPVRVEDLAEHQVASERYEISEAAASAINRTRENKKRIVAVGTTTVRALESAADDAGHIRAVRGETSLTITPGYEFRVVDSVVTNFHLPRSSLLLLVAAFAGRDLTLAAYAHAVGSRYRFYSYGDCMLII
jgi:S-adenosylmethionine:tRNA ribosyltransferase-isomerase